MPRINFTVALATAVIGTLAPGVADAHFILQTPQNWATQDTTGTPQKSAPCGQADPGSAAVATNAVTAFQTGQTITVTVNETVFHPGHYRVALSTTDQSGLPADPTVTAGTTACGSTVIESPPVFPVLADGMLQHTAAFSGPQSFDVTLPSGMTCTKCTLQIIEFMSNHGLNVPGGCFYHHCADISIQGSSGTGGTTGGGGTAGAAGGGSGGTGMGGGGGGCATGGAGTSNAAPVLALAAFALRRLRRRRT